ncbi:unnamed protein product, partial [Ectocarpus sp. 12 AP-2014]
MLPSRQRVDFMCSCFCSFVEGRSLFAVMGLPLDDALPPLVA